MKYLLILFVVFSFQLSACVKCENQIAVQIYQFQQIRKSYDDCIDKTRAIEDEIMFLDGIIIGLQNAHSIAKYGY